MADSLTHRGTCPVCGKDVSVLRERIGFKEHRACRAHADWELRRCEGSGQVCREDQEVKSNV
jgi:hypothetical protein